MKIRKHFRVSISTIDYIISDLSLNRITDKNLFFHYCVNNRITRLSEAYDTKLDKILTYLISKCDYESLPLTMLSRIVLSVSKITNVLSKGFLSLL